METNIFDYGMNGEGVGKIDEKIILVDNTLIDEVVDIEVIEDNKNYCLGKLNSIITASNNRQVPPCPHFSNCGGCQLQHMIYDEQLKFKTNHIKKTIKKITGLDVQVNDTIACSKTSKYRNKMSFSVHKSSCGLLKFNSKEIVDLSTCPLATDEINSILTIFKEYLTATKSISIKNLVVRSIEDQILIGVVTNKILDLKNLLSTFLEHFNNIGLYQIVNTRNDSVVLSGKVIHVGGIKNIKINNFGLTYYVDLMGFHQTNLEIQDKLYNHVLKSIDENSIVVNGFSGQGLLTAIIAKKAKQVIGIEINKSSHESAEQLKKINNIKKMRNICGDFFKCFKKELNNANTIILDPTKKGCGSKVMNEIKGIENIIYISCNPIALAKDLNIIKDEYLIEEITPFDMFPNTTNVETFVRLKKKV